MLLHYIYYLLVELILRSVWMESFEPETFTVVVNTSAVAFKVDERFLSVGLSPKHLGNATAQQLFREARFKTLLQGLAPCYLRAGGTAGQFVTFNRSQAPDDLAITMATTPPIYETSGKLQKQHNITMYGDQWDFINNWARENGAKLLYQINDMKRSNNVWDSTNFRSLLDYTLHKTYAENLGFEFGNEPNAYRIKFNVTLSASAHAKEFLQAVRMLRRQQPYAGVFNRSLIVAPDVTDVEKRPVAKYLTRFLGVACNDVDKVTCHQYYLSSKKDVLTALNFTDPSELDSLGESIHAAQRALQEAGCSHRKLWLGETASASGGGAEGLSDSFVSTFMWLDKLGLSASQGIDVVIRQTLFMEDDYYALITKDLRINPDYWISYIYKRLVGRQVYNVTVSDASRKLRCYAANRASQSKHFTSSTGDQSSTSTSQEFEHSNTLNANHTIYCLNLHSTEISFTLELNYQPCCIYEYILQSPDSLLSRQITLNGEILEMRNHTLPDITPRKVGQKNKLVLQPFSLAFYNTYAHCDKLC